MLFDPIDKIKLYGNYIFINSPNFLLTNELCSQFLSKRKESKYNMTFVKGIIKKEDYELLKIDKKKRNKNHKQTTRLVEQKKK